MYLMWQTGGCTNQQIGDMFGLTYSAVSRRVAIAKVLVKKDKAFREKGSRVKSQNKI